MEPHPIETDKDLWKVPLLGGTCGGGRGGAAAEAEPLASFGPNSVGAGQRTPLVLQRGGNTIRASTADALNEYAGASLSRREWGRAVEALKSDLGLGNDFHGTILDNGAYHDNAGNHLGNLLDYLPR